MLPSTPHPRLPGGLCDRELTAFSAEQLYLKVLSGIDLHTLPMESSLVSSLRINTRGKSASCPPPQRSLKVPVMGPSQPGRRSVALQGHVHPEPNPSEVPGQGRPAARGKGPWAIFASPSFVSPRVRRGLQVGMKFRISEPLWHVAQDPTRGLGFVTLGTLAVPGPRSAKRASGEPCTCLPSPQRRIL